MEDICWIMPVKRGVDGLRGEGGEDGNNCGTDVEGVVYVDLQYWYVLVRTGKRITKGMERTLDSFGISSRQSPLCITSGFPSLTACLICRPNNVCCMLET